MVHILKRMRKLQTLFWIRHGPGALILPKEVSKISMEFNTKLYGGHRGARKFWREMLPRIKYRNPSISIEINRHNVPEGPSLLHIYTHAKTQPSSSTAASAVATPGTVEPDTTPPTYTLDIRDQQEGEILEAFVKTLECQEVKPSAEEIQQMRELAEQGERSEKDRVLVREMLLKERREAQLLKMARGEAAEAVA